MNEREIFQLALDISDPAERHAWLEQACGGDATFRARIEALLTSYAAVSQFLKVPVVQQLKPSLADAINPTLVLPMSSAANVNRDDNGDDETSGAPDLSFLQPSSKSRPCHRGAQASC